MKRAFSLAYLTVPGAAPVEQIHIAAEAGYDCVSLRTIPMRLPNEPLFELEKDQKLFCQVRKALEDTGIKLMDIELARVREDLDVRSYTAAFEKAAELGATQVLSSIWSKDRDFYLREFERLCEIAGQFALTVNLEFVSFAGVTDLAEALNVVDTVGAPNAKIMVDTLHAHRSFVTPAEIGRVCPDKFGFIHLCDGPGPVPPQKDPEFIAVAREKRLYVGMGGIDIAAYLKALPARALSIELPNAKNMGAFGALGHARLCLESAKAYCAQSGVAL